MSKNYTDITDDLIAQMKQLGGQVPDVMTAFQSLAKEATKDGVLDKKTKEFVALAIGVATHCDGCVGFHAKALAKLDASRDEVSEILGMSIYMGGGPSLMYAAEALAAFDEFKAKL